MRQIYQGLSGVGLLCMGAYMNLRDLVFVIIRKTKNIGKNIILLLHNLSGLCYHSDKADFSSDFLGMAV